MTSEIIIACPGRSRYFDLDAIRTPHTEPGVVKRTTKGSTRGDGWGRPSDSIEQNPAGAPPLDHWWHNPDDPNTTIEPIEWDGNVTATWHTGDSLTVLRTLPTASVDLILTSPPFLALRSYLPADDPNKPLEMGSEPTPGQFLDALLDVVVECRRVLAPHGSLCVELGDTYATSGGPTGDEQGNERYPNGKSAGLIASRIMRGTGWPSPKSLCLIPETFRFALAYGRNPHTGRTLEPWRIRNVIRWCRPNPPVGALGDKVRPATSDIAVACMSGRRYFDLDAVRSGEQTIAGGTTGRHKHDGRDPRGERGELDPIVNTGSHPAGAPPLDHWWHNPDDMFDQDAWLIPTEPYPGSYYATWPRALCIKPILAMCPQRVCTVCGKPSERIVDVASQGEWRRTDLTDDKVNHGGPGTHGDRTRIAETLGWSDCGDACRAVYNNNPNKSTGRWRPGHVLDPFAGSGTTGVVATGHGRDFTGIDLDSRNYDLARERIGMWLDHAEPRTVDVPTGELL